MRKVNPQIHVIGYVIYIILLILFLINLFRSDRVQVWRVVDKHNNEKHYVKILHYADQTALFARHKHQLQSVQESRVKRNSPMSQCLPLSDVFQTHEKQLGIVFDK